MDKLHSTAQDSMKALKTRHILEECTLERKAFHTDYQSHVSQTILQPTRAIPPESWLSWIPGLLGWALMFWWWVCLYISGKRLSIWLTCASLFMNVALKGSAVSWWPHAALHMITMQLFAEEFPENFNLLILLFSFYAVALRRSRCWVELLGKGLTMWQFLLFVMVQPRDCWTGGW